MLPELEGIWRAGVRRGDVVPARHRRGELAGDVGFCRQLCAGAFRSPGGVVFTRGGAGGRDSSRGVRDGEVYDKKGSLAVRAAKPDGSAVGNGRETPERP